MGEAGNMLQGIQKNSWTHSQKIEQAVKKLKTFLVLLDKW